MNYIYDIILNFNETYIDFYDWNIDDDIKEIRKIPIFRVDRKTFKELYNYSFKLKDEFWDKIKNKCEVYIGKSIKHITAFLITDTEKIVAFKIDNEICISSLQIVDELDILDELNIPITHIKYSILNKKNMSLFKTRNQLSNELFIKDYLKYLFKENNESKIKYIYYECFNKKEMRLNIIKEQFKNITNNCEIMNKLYNILISISTINN